ncbi:hypothetical protein ACFVYA_17360 [Amycolatopsis sp. NPDC058278]|uniref:hypothetical protein n=1 Tax=Amycolatopsis sp. NPDC058278 TaxID=3346417 RepID=UPI0036DDB096
MNWSAVNPAILPLIGVTLGVGGSIAVQYLVTRTTKQQATAKRVADLRWERKEAIREFLDAVQSVERLAECRHMYGNLDDGPELLTHRMWFLQKCIDIVGTPRLRQAALDYASRLHDAVYGEMPEGQNVWEFMGERRHPFLEAARRELDVPEFDRSLLAQ